MRISVECGGLVDAAGATLTANHVAALLTESLAGKLVGYAGMAGDDATSAEFAASYDAGAREAVRTLTELTHALIGLGRLIDGTRVHHAAAEGAAAGLGTTAYVGGGLDEDSWVRVAPATPPSSLGRQEPSLGAVDRWILDQVEGFVWPGADVHLLRDAAHTWRRSAESVAGLGEHLSIAAGLLSRQRSPEIPAALAAVEQLQLLVADAANDLTALGAACEEYAAAVESAHDRTRALLAEIATMVVEGVAISAFFATLSGGLVGGASAGAVLVRIRAQAPRFSALLVSVRGAAAVAAARLRTARESLRSTREALAKFARVPAHNERGEIMQPLGWISALARRPPGWLKAHEVPPGHTLERHVGKTGEELLERCQRDGLRQVSSFSSQEAAERLITEVVERRATDVRAWMRSGSMKKLELDYDFASPTGISGYADGRVATVHRVRVVLIPNPSMPSGWQVLTAFPT